MEQLEAWKKTAANEDKIDGMTKRSKDRVKAAMLVELMESNSVLGFVGINREANQ